MLLDSACELVLFPVRHINIKNFPFDGSETADSSDFKKILLQGLQLHL